jgi:hypothetical protein
VTGNNTLFVKIESKPPLIVGDPVFAQTNIFGVFWNENSKLANYTFCVATGTLNTSNASALRMIQLNSDTAVWSSCLGSPVFFVDASDPTSAALLSGVNGSTDNATLLLACVNFSEPIGLLGGRKRFGGEMASPGTRALLARREKRVFIFGDSQGYFYTLAYASTNSSDNNGARGMLSFSFYLGLFLFYFSSSSSSSFLSFLTP